MDGTITWMDLRQLHLLFKKQLTFFENKRILDLLEMAFPHFADDKGDQGPLLGDHQQV